MAGPGNRLTRMTPSIGILGLGAVGSQLVQRFSTAKVKIPIILHDLDISKTASLIDQLDHNFTQTSGARIEDEDISILVIASPSGQHLQVAQRAIKKGISVISTSDRISDVVGLLKLKSLAEKYDASVIAGAGFSPGLTCALARFAAKEFDFVDEIHIAKDGTGGPACAKQHHRAMKRPSLDWWEGEWVRRPGGSGRELVWFPEPIAGSDCYRAALPEAVLLQTIFPNSSRITSRLSATRQDRFTSWLPMLIPPHNDGGIGAVRVEVRGRLENERITRVLGAVSPPSSAAAIVVQTLTEMMMESLIDPFTGGVANIVDSTSFLNRVTAKGIKTVEFDGMPSN
ncbi:MAG TPA: hypothetical protein QF431_02620 [Acidimicrobiales bacterium]|nr:hypothetical protein [Acidimicrobiales bacterium]